MRLRTKYLHHSAVGSESVGGVIPCGCRLTSHPPKCFSNLLWDQLYILFFIRRKRQILCFDIISSCVRVQANHESHTDNRRPARLFPDSTSLLSPYTPGVNNRKLHFRESRTACTLVGDTCEQGTELEE